MLRMSRDKQGRIFTLLVTKKEADAFLKDFEIAPVKIQSGLIHFRITEKRTGNSAVKMLDAEDLEHLGFHNLESKEHFEKAINECPDLIWSIAGETFEAWNALFNPQRAELLNALNEFKEEERKKRREEERKN